MEGSSNTPQLARNVKRLSRLDLPGAGQVYVEGNYAYIGHLPNKQQLGTTHPRRVRPAQAAHRVADLSSTTRPRTATRRA